MLIIEIHNDGTGDEKHGNYTYRVLINREVKAEGKIKDYYRPAGWACLVEEFASQLKRDEQIKFLAKAAEAFQEFHMRGARASMSGSE